MQFDRLQYIYFITFDYYSAFFEVDKLETTDFRTVVEKLKMQCNACNSYKPEQSQEPLMPHEIPTRPWQKIEQTWCNLIDSSTFTL